MYEKKTATTNAASPAYLCIILYTRRDRYMPLKL